MENWQISLIYAGAALVLLALVYVPVIVKERRK
jgi:hypothetical protein